MRRLLLLLALFASPLAAQVTVTLPNTVNPAGQPIAVDRHFIVKADGTVVGDTNPLSIAGPAPSASAANALAIASTGSVSGGFTAKGQAANLYRISITTGATAGYMMIFNATTVPADGAVTPVVCRAVPINSTYSASWAEMPARFSTGISVAFSSTGCFTKTVSNTAFWEVQAQ